MALYIGGQKIAGAGGGGSANIVSCDSYEDYMSRTHDPKTMYVTPDAGGGSSMSAYVKSVDGIRPDAASGNVQLSDTSSVSSLIGLIAELSSAQTWVFTLSDDSEVSASVLCKTLTA